MTTTPIAPTPRPTAHVFIAASVDGYIARSNGDIEWLSRYAAVGEDHGYDAFVASIEAIVMGRGTFDKVLSFGEWPYRKPVIVMSRSLSSADLADDLLGKVRIFQESPDGFMELLGREGVGRVYVDGGAVIQSFLRARLIADFILTRIPVLLGEGIALFGSLLEDVPLAHVETKTFPSGLVQSIYQIASSGEATRS